MIKTFFYLFSILACVLAINSGRIIASESTDLTTMSNMGFLLVIGVLLVMFLYMFIYALINVIQQLKNKREIRWNY